MAAIAMGLAVAALPDYSFVRLKRGVSLRRTASLAIAGLILAGCAATDIETESRNFQVQQTSVATGAGQASLDTMSELVRASGPSYVTLVVSGGKDAGVILDQKDQKKSAVTAGSGFVVDQAGHIMTAAHVAVRAGNTVSARAANGRVYSGTVVAILPTNDMAIVKLRGFSGKAVSPAATRCLDKGSMVYSLGRPHAQGDTARIGELDSPRFGRAVTYGPFGYPDAMVLRLSTQKGESGGPLFDQSGRLVGMIVSTLYDGAGKPLNLAHAIPLEKLAGFLCSKTSCPGTWQQAASAQSCGG
jgi:S1-C subfamily serine protease